MDSFNNAFEWWAFGISAGGFAGAILIYALEPLLGRDARHHRQAIREFEKQLEQWVKQEGGKNVPREIPDNEVGKSGRYSVSTAQGWAIIAIATCLVLLVGVETEGLTRVPSSLVSIPNLWNTPSDDQIREALGDLADGGCEVLARGKTLVSDGTTKEVRAGKPIYPVRIKYTCKGRGKFLVAGTTIEDAYFYTNDFNEWNYYVGGSAR